MKLNLFIAIVFSSVLLMSCGDEASKTTEASTEQTSIKTTTDQTADSTIAEGNMLASSEVNGSTNDETSSKDSQNSNPNASDENTSKGENTKAKKRGVPQIVFAEKTYNFGTVEEGEKVKVEFEFTNTGTGDLLIANAKGSCGCTEPSFRFLPIPPNGKSSIDVTFKTAGREGMQRKSVTVTTNAYPKIRKLYLEGRVVPKGEMKEEVKEEIKEVEAAVEQVEEKTDDDQ